MENQGPIIPEPKRSLPFGNNPFVFVLILTIILTIGLIGYLLISFDLDFSSFSIFYFFPFLIGPTLLMYYLSQKHNSKKSENSDTSEPRTWGMKRKSNYKPHEFIRVAITIVIFIVFLIIQAINYLIDLVTQ